MAWKHCFCSTSKPTAALPPIAVLLLSLLVTGTWAGKHPHAYVCLVINTGYAKGCTGLGKSLLHTGSLSSADFLVLYLTPKIRAEDLQQLAAISPNVVLRGVERLDLTSHRHYVHSFMKLRCWQQTDYHKVVYLDADVIAMQNLSFLFAYEELGVTQDMYFYIHKTFNSGLLVLKPSNETFATLVNAAYPQRYKGWGDQNFLNEFYAQTAVYLPPSTLLLNWFLTMKAVPVRAYWHAAKAIHFAGLKPWVNTSDPKEPHFMPEGNNDHVRWPVLGALQDLWTRIYNSPVSMSNEEVAAMYAEPHVPTLVRCHLV